ncbi:MAG: type II toxin-antitoxin system Phd/YefM family antitoxin [Actinomycetota bacterium]|nr:type II toxin-antitoxin system Phd/YefM family antitoxin [Actinomycetota bacterium]
MTKRTTAIKARQNLGQLLEESYYRGDEFVIERAGKPMAALIPIQEYERWQAQREKDFAALEQVREQAAQYTPEEVQRDVAEAVRKVRKRHAPGRS